MRRILSVTDLHLNDKKDFNTLTRIVKKSDPDIAAVLGDYCHYELFENQLSISNLYHSLLHELCEWDIPTIINPGNSDLRIFEDGILNYPTIAYPKEKIKTVDGLKVYGIPGSEEYLYGHGYDPRDFYVRDLDMDIIKIIGSFPYETPDILVTHKGPRTSDEDHLYGDGTDYVCFREEGNYVGSASPTDPKAVKSNRGSEGIRALYEAIQPRLGLCGHFHEGIGVDRIGKSITINPGSFCQNWHGKKSNYALILYDQGVRDVILGNSKGEYKVDLGQI